MELIETQDWSFLTPIAYGPGRLKEIGTASVAEFQMVIEEALNHGR